MTLVTGALERAITLGRGGVLDIDALRRRAAGYDRLQELEHQFQIPVEGLATTNLTWDLVDIPFDVEFFFAPQQRDSPLVFPHFTYGYAVTGDTDDSATPGTADTGNPYGLVAIHANVIGWSEDVAREAIVGARVGIGVMCGGPAATAVVDYRGHVHLTFQGWGHIGGADSGDNNAMLDVGA